MKKLLAKLWRSLGLSKHLQLFVMRFTQDRFLVGVTGIFFNERNEVLVFKHTYRKIAWSLPGGYMKAKEHPIEGIEREITEESGFSVSVDDQLKIRTDRETSRLEICFVGTFIGGQFKESAEVSDAQFFSFENLPVIARSQLLFIEEALRNRKEKK